MADAASAPAGRREVATLILLGGSAVLATGLPLPFGLAAVAFAIPAFIVAVKVLAGRGPQPRVFAVLTIALVVMLTGVALLRAVFYPAQYEYQECLRAAITVEGQRVCEEQLRSSLMRFVGVPTDG